MSTTNKWEYHTEDLVATGSHQRPQTTIPTLQQLGAEGWELVYASSSKRETWPSDNAGLWLHGVVFKRPARD